MIENRLIKEMARVRGGRGRLEKIRSECYDEIERLKNSIGQIDIILEGDTWPKEEAIDSPTE